MTAETAGQGTIRMADFTAMSPTAAPISQSGSRASSRKSMFMPTVKKNRPSSRPLNGSIAVSIALRNSVSASSNPATKAPSAIDRPAAAAATPVATITNSVVATNSSFMPADATRRNRGLITRRPTMTITPIAIAVLVRATARMARTEPSSLMPEMEMKSSSGATARSCASSVAKLARPALVLSRPWRDSTSSTMAVEDRARHAPRISVRPSRRRPPLRPCRR